MTVLVLSYLTNVFANKKGTWKLLVNKAKKWLKSNGIDFKYAIFLEKALEFLKIN